MVGSRRTGQATNPCRLPSTICPRPDTRRLSIAPQSRRASAVRSIPASRSVGSCWRIETYDPSNAFRINPTLAAGALTAPMAVPWQADFNDCQVDTGADWWPAQRPNQVQRGVQRHAPWVPPEWNAPGTAPHRAMVDNWAQLGFVVETDVDGTVTYVEAEHFRHPMSATPRHCDVAVIGGGPAGAATALALVRAGRSVVMLEKSRYDVTNIGETLPPRARAWLERLGVWRRFVADGHRPSPAVLSAWGDSELQATHHVFSPYGQGWHVDRPQRFDAMLGEAASNAGVRVRCGTTLGTCESLGNDGWRLELTPARRTGGGEHLHARCVVDATGRVAVWARQAGGETRQQRSARGDCGPAGEQRQGLIIAAAAIQLGMMTMRTRLSRRRRAGGGTARPCHGDALSRRTSPMSTCCRHVAAPGLASGTTALARPATRAHACHAVAPARGSPAPRRREQFSSGPCERHGLAGGW